MVLRNTHRVRLLQGVFSSPIYRRAPQTWSGPHGPHKGVASVLREVLGEAIGRKTSLDRAGRLWELFATPRCDTEDACGMGGGTCCHDFPGPRGKICQLRL